MAGLRDEGVAKPTATPMQESATTTGATAASAATTPDSTAAETAGGAVMQNIDTEAGCAKDPELNSVLEVNTEEHDLNNQRLILCK